MFLLTILLDYPKNVCAKILLDEKEDKPFWIYKGKKYKVYTIERDLEWYLRLLYFLLFDLAYALCELSFLFTLKRVKTTKSFIILFQILKYFLNVAIIVLTFCREKYCEKSDNDENIFYIKTNILVKI